MNPSSAISPQALQALLLLAREQVATALWLSAGMVCAVASLAANAIGYRRWSLLLGLLYSGTLCFVHNGHAQVLGPLGCTAALAGFAWPGRRARR